MLSDPEWEGHCERYLSRTIKYLQLYYGDLLFFLLLLLSLPFKRSPFASGFQLGHTVTPVYFISICWQSLKCIFYLILPYAKVISNWHICRAFVIQQFNV